MNVIGSGLVETPLIELRQLSYSEGQMVANIMETCSVMEIKPSSQNEVPKRKVPRKYVKTRKHRRILSENPAIVLQQMADETDSDDDEPDQYFCESCFMGLKFSLNVYTDDYDQSNDVSLTQSELSPNADNEQTSCNVLETTFTNVRRCDGYRCVEAGVRPLTRDLARLRKAMKYYCEVCATSFYYKENLQKHFKTHKIYKCSYCRRRFVYSFLLKEHEAIHTKGKPFSCDICNKEFAHKQTLKSHVGIHAGRKPFRCVFCEKDFRLKQLLVQHEKTKKHRMTVLRARNRLEESDSSS